MAKKKDRGNPEPVEDILLDGFHAVEQLIAKEFLAVKPLTRRQYLVISTLLKDEGISQTALVEKTGVDRSTLADIVRNLIQRGLLARKRRPEDQRAYSVTVTEAGKEAVAMGNPVAKQAVKVVFSSLSAAEANTLRALLRKVLGRKAG